MAAYFHCLAPKVLAQKIIGMFLMPDFLVLADQTIRTTFKVWTSPSSNLFKGLSKLVSVSLIGWYSTAIEVSVVNCSYLVRWLAKITVVIFSWTTDWLVL